MYAHVYIRVCGTAERSSLILVIFSIFLVSTFHDGFYRNFTPLYQPPIGPRYPMPTSLGSLQSVEVEESQSLLNINKS